MANTYENWEGADEDETDLEKYHTVVSFLFRRGFFINVAKGDDFHAFFFLEISPIPKFFSLFFNIEIRRDDGRDEKNDET